MNDNEIKKRLKESLASTGQSQAAIRQLLKPHFRNDDTDDEEFDAIVEADDNRKSIINSRAGTSFRKSNKGSKY